MSKRDRTEKNVLENRNRAVESLDKLLSELMESDNPKDLKSADLISYWVQTYIRFIKKEKAFDPSKYIKYSRGDIVKVDLGYNIGSEEGGLHYAVVVDNNNSKKSGTLTIIPLSSIREGRKVHSSSVVIGKEIFTSIVSKHDRMLKNVKSRIEENEKKIANKSELSNVDIDNIKEELLLLNNKIFELKKLRQEILKMKKGSVALTSQITTISKIRVYDPIYSHSVLYGIRLSPQTLDK